VTESLKAVTRSKRGSGVRRRVEPASTIPGNWQVFLRIDENKTELFSFLATKITTIETRKQVVTTHDLDVLCININQQQVSTLTPCTHEEADTRMLLHLKNAVQQGHNSVSIRTVDTDVVVLAVTAAESLVSKNYGLPLELIAAYEIARALGPGWCVALPVFHAFTGCDTVSFFGGRGKRTAWDTWKAYEDVTQESCALATSPTYRIIEEWLGPLERFVVLMYDRTSRHVRVNEARK